MKSYEKLVKSEERIVNSEKLCAIARDYQLPESLKLSGSYYPYVSEQLTIDNGKWTIEK